jgi:hypothetical protein
VQPTLLIKNIYINRPIKKIDYRFLGPFVVTERIKMGTLNYILSLHIRDFTRYFILFYFLKFYRRKTGVEQPFPSLIKINGEKEWQVKKF